MFACVKETRELFILNLVADPDREHLRVVALPLIPDKEYMGLYYPGSYVGSSPFVEVSAQEIAWFMGSELEDAPTDGLRLVCVRSSSSE